MTNTVHPKKTNVMNMLLLRMMPGIDLNQADATSSGV